MCKSCFQLLQASETDMSSMLFDGIGPSTMRASEAAVYTAEDVVRRVHADCAVGLSEEEVERRRKMFGKNEFTIKNEETLWKKYLNQVKLCMTIIVHVHVQSYNVESTCTCRST